MTDDPSAKAVTTTRGAAIHPAASCHERRSNVVRSIRRYPVKSMGGEDLDTVRVDTRGLTGDRWFAVRDQDGHLVSGKNSRRFRRHDEIFDYRSYTIDDTVYVHHGVRSWPVGDPALDRQLSRHLRTPVTVQPEDVWPHHDDSPVSLVGTATLHWCAQQWGINADPRRLRVNLVIATDEPFIEESWQGRDLTLGTATLTVTQPAPRCRMIDIDQDGATASDRWLKALAEHRNLQIAVYAHVNRPGTITTGDPITTPRRPRRDDNRAWARHRSERLYSA